MIRDSIGVDPLVFDIGVINSREPDTGFFLILTHSESLQFHDN